MIDDTKAEVVRLRTTTDMSMREIAKQLGLTKNAVSGIASRAGLCRAENSPIRNAPAVKPGRLDNRRKAVIGPAEVPVTGSELEPTSKPCRFFMSDKGNGYKNWADVPRCPNKAVMGPYCEEHYRKCYRTTEKWTGGESNAAYGFKRGRL